MGVDMSTSTVIGLLAVVVIYSILVYRTVDTLLTALEDREWIWVFTSGAFIALCTAVAWYSANRILAP